MKRFPFLLVLLLAMAACAPPLLRATQVPQHTPTPSPASVASPAPTAAAPATSDPPASTLFPLAWDDRSPFVAGLIASEQKTLAERPGASVYHLAITIANDLAQLQGREEVRYTNTETAALDRILFRLFPNLADGRATVTQITVNGAPITPSYELEQSAMVVTLEPPLPPGAQVVIGMEFLIEVPTDGGGNYGTFALREEVLALAHFYPMIAVFDDEGWNAEIAPEIGDVVYADTAYYLVRIEAPEQVTLAASGVAIDRQTQGGRQQITFAAGPMRDFYVVASERYQEISAQVGETTLHAYAPPQLAAENRVALDFAVAAFRSYSARFGVYPFTELDVAGTPTDAGGVEYPGIVVIALDIYDPENRFFESATTHEVAHQWFYSLVGNDQIDEPWLDESLTQYATMLYYADAYGDAGRTGFRNALTSRWDRVDREETPIGLPVAAYDGTAYSAIVYGRGPLFFEALEEKMGAAAFAAFLRHYYDTFKWDIVTTESLKALAEQECACDLTALFEEWVY